MSSHVLVRRRRKGASPMQVRRIGAHAHAAAGAAEAFPGSEVPEPEGLRGRIFSGGLSVLLHGLIIAALLLAAWLAPEEMVEEIIEITRIEEEVAAPEEPAPAPKVIAESAGRFDPAPMAMAPQIVNPVVVQRAAPVINAKALQVDSVSPVRAPTEVKRAGTVVEQARAYESIASATASPVAIDAQAPQIRGPVEIQAPSGIQSGPRQIASTGNTVGIAAPNALGTGSSVREGIASDRDVHGAKTGVRANVNWNAGRGGRGSGGTGTGPGGVTWDQCMQRAEVQQYLSRMKRRVLSRWTLPVNVAANQAVTLRFILDPAGTANRVDFVPGGHAGLGESAVSAMRSASPFDQMSDRVRCLAGSPIQATFKNPTVATN